MEIVYTQEWVDNVLPHSNKKKRKISNIRQIIYEVKSHFFHFTFRTNNIHENVRRKWKSIQEFVEHKTRPIQLIVGAPTIACILTSPRNFNFLQSIVGKSSTRSTDKDFFRNNTMRVLLRFGFTTAPTNLNFLRPSVNKSVIWATPWLFGVTGSASIVVTNVRQSPTNSDLHVCCWTEI